MDSDDEERIAAIYLPNLSASFTVRSFWFPLQLSAMHMGDQEFDIGYFCCFSSLSAIKPAFLFSA
jgi:hypothetical protein